MIFPLIKINVAFNYRSDLCKWIDTRLLNAIPRAFHTILVFLNSKDALTEDIVSIAIHQMVSAYGGLLLTKGTSLAELSLLVSYYIIK